MSATWREAGREPAVDELLGDPIAALLRARDGLTRHDVDRVIEAVRQRMPSEAGTAPVGCAEDPTDAANERRAAGC